MNACIMQEIRNVSLDAATSLGYRINENLPLLEAGLSIERTREEVARRALCLFCVVAVANNSNASIALDWAHTEGIADAFTSAEIDFLQHPSESTRPAFLAQEEALWALSWSAGFHERFDFNSYCDSSLAKVFPAVRRGESSKSFLRRISLRDGDEIIRKLDLAYCLHWAIVDDRIHRRTSPHNVEGYVIVERRRSLEWLLCKEHWDEISLDT